MARDSLVTLCTSLAGSCYWSSSPLVTGIEDSEREMEGFGTIGIASPGLVWPISLCSDTRALHKVRNRVRRFPEVSPLLQRTSMGLPAQ